MDQWKTTPRASRKDDDALWGGRFRAAQDVFFSNRQAANEQIDQEYTANLAVKEQLVAEAQALLPINDLNAAKKALQSIRTAGKMPARFPPAPTWGGLRPGFARSKMRSVKPRKRSGAGATRKPRPAPTAPCHSLNRLLQASRTIWRRPRRPATSAVSSRPRGSGSSPGMA